jgi:glycosyltransferase involved in cell wall biosynthesis
LKNTKKLLFISDCYVSETVFVSQVHTICNEHSNLFDVTLVVMCTFKNITLPKPAGAKYKLVKRIKLPKLYIPWVNFLFSRISFLVKYYRRADIVHGRGHVGAALALNLAKKNINNKIVADIRGALDYEILDKKLSNIHVRQCRILESIIFDRINSFLFVSENMKNFYMNRYNLSDKSINVIPTAVDDNLFYKDDYKREKIRDKLRLGNKFVFLYVGGSQKWQNIDLIIEDFGKAIKINTEISLIILTPNIELVKALIKQKNINLTDIHVDHVNYKDVPYYMNSADAGIIIRDNQMINYVASPTKISEYAACDLKLATSTGQFSSLSGFTRGRYMSLNEIINSHKNIYFNLCCS